MHAVDRAARRPGTGLAALVLAGGLALLQACGGGNAGPAASEALPLPSGRVNGANPIALGCSASTTANTVVYANAEVEPILARAPGNPQVLLAAWQQDRYNNGGARGLVSALSVDGGATWSQTLHPMSRCGGAATGSAGDFERASDPWVDIGSDGTLHIMGLALSGTALASGSRNAMLASRSTDGGRSWSPPQVLVQDGADRFNDKNTLTVDTLDPQYVYAVWDRLEPDGNGPTLLARSTNAGASWEPVREIYRPAAPTGGSAQTIGNRILVVPNGAHRGVLVNVFTQIVVGGGSVSTTVQSQRSTDRGLSWAPPVPVGDHRAVGARDSRSGVAIRDGNIVPAMTTAPDGSLWVAWQDSRFSGGSVDAIVVSRSVDGGQTWSTPARASSSSGVPTFTPTLHAREDGLVGLMYFDLRPSATSAQQVPAAVWLGTSRDGSSWTETSIWPFFDMALAPQAGGLFLGDYMGLSSQGEQFLPLLALSSSQLDNRTDVYLLTINPGSVAVALGQRPVQPAAEAQSTSSSGYAARHQAFIQRTMDSRLPGWSQRVGLGQAKLGEASPCKQPAQPGLAPPC